MSLLRAIIRTTAVAALRQQTFAGAQVFDSDQTPFVEAVQGQAAAPYITVYTDTDDRMPSQPGVTAGREILNGDARNLCLVLEMAVASATKNTDGGYTLTTSATDPGMEFAMDIMEMQAVSALFTGVTNPWGALLRKMIQRIKRMPSRRGGQATSGVRFAARRTTFMCTTMDDILAGQTLPIDHPVNCYLALVAKFPDLNFGDYAALVSNYLSGKASLASWQVAQGMMGMDRLQVRTLNPDGTPLPYPPIETPPFDWSDQNPNAPSLEDVILGITDPPS